MENEDRSTRHRVTALLLEHGPQTASELAARLGISPAAVRRHLDALLASGRVEERQGAPGVGGGQRGRGRPARYYHLIEVGRSAFPHAYDDLALTALRHIATSQGPAAVRAVAEAQLSGLEQRCSTAVERATAGRGGAPVDRAQALAAALTAEGYAAAASTIAGGGQLCQHHCPVAHVAAEFPQLCEAETAVIGRLVGTHVQRLATIAHGDGVCTTHIPGPLLSGPARGSGEHRRPGNRPAPARPVPGDGSAPRTRRGPRSTSSSTLMLDRERTSA